MGQDFEQQRRESTARARTDAAARDAQRQQALQAGARAPSRAEGDPSGPLRAVRNACLAVAGLALVAGVIGWGSIVAALAAGAFALFGSGAAAAHLLARSRRAAGAGEEVRLAALAAQLTTASPVELAHSAARRAVEQADLGAERRLETLSALDSARDEVRALLARGLSGDAGAPVQARADAFVARCNAIATELASAQGPPPPSALDALDALAEDLRLDRSAGREIDAALAAARRARQGQ